MISSNTFSMPLALGLTHDKIDFSSALVGDEVTFLKTKLVFLVSAVDGMYVPPSYVAQEDD